MRLSMSTLSIVACVVSACQSDGVSPNPDPSTVSFIYQGLHTGGVFEASGEATLDPSGMLVRADYAGAVVRQPGTTLAGTVVLIANDAAGANHGNMIRIDGVPPRVGTYAFSPAASPWGLFQPSIVWTASQFGGGTAYGLSSGELTVTSVSASRIAGSFRGIATDVDGRAGSLTVANGRFDVALNDPALVSVSCALFWC